MYLSSYFSLSVGGAAGFEPASFEPNPRAWERPSIFYLLVLGVDAERAELEAGVPAVLSEEIKDRAVFLLVLLEVLGGTLVTESQELLGNVV